jgi:putative ABC transport system substrate-binding protein
MKCQFSGGRLRRRTTGFSGSRAHVARNAAADPGRSAHLTQKRSSEQSQDKLLKLRVIAISMGFALSILAAALAAEAQPQPKPARLGILAPISTRLPQYSALRQALRDLGYQEGWNLVIEERAAEGKADRLAELAVDLVRRNVDVILAPGPEATLRAARQATRTIPIVMVAIDYDPMALGYVASLARPGGNITGVFLQQLELTAKRLELLKESLPGMSQVAVLWDGSSADQWKVVEGTARSIGMQVQSLELRDPPYDFERAFQTVSRGGIKALLVLMSPVFFRDRIRIADLPGRAADQIRAHHQSQDREGARSHRSAADAGASGYDHRVDVSALTSGT